ncbi:MAG: PP2C family protein-serine/threonine phosphatase [Candidatus Acidiferrales bacterium]
MNRFEPRRLLIFLRRTSLLDRIAFAIVLLYVVARIASAYSVQLSYLWALGLLCVAAVIYSVIRLIPWVRHDFMWPLRNRLIVAYVFIAVVPVILLLTMVGVGSYLLYLQLGAHLIQDDMQQRISTMASRGESIANAIEAEEAKGVPSDPESLLSRPRVSSLIDAAKSEWPGLDVYLNRGKPLLKAGNGREYAGLIEFENKLYFASEMSRDGPAGPIAVLTVAPLTTAVLDGFSAELGAIQLMLLQPVPGKAGSQLTIKIDKQSYVPGEQVASRRRALPPAANFLDIRVRGVSTIEAVHAEPQTAAADAPVFAAFALRPSAVNRSLFTSVGAVGPFLIDLLLIAAVIFLIFEIAALITGVVLTRTITSAVADLYDATLHVRRGDFTYRVRVHQRDQLGSLGDSFNEMTGSVGELIEEQRQRQHLENEITIAREVQEQLFPKTVPSLPGLQLAAICRPARTVSGDYYDFLPLGPNRVGIALADISGKGIFAALLMASLQASLRSQAMMDGAGGTAELVSRLNKYLYLNTSDDRYATFFYGIYDAQSKMLTYTNAGHLPPFLIADSGCEQLDEGGTVVGLFEDCTYTQRTLKIAPGSVLVAFSDGLTEPENVYGEEFGVERLKDEVMRLRNFAPDRLVETLVAAAEQWAGTAEQADDITVVVARMG